MSFLYSETVGVEAGEMESNISKSLGLVHIDLGTITFVQREVKNLPDQGSKMP